MTGAIIRPGPAQGSHPDDVLLARMIAAVTEDLRLNSEASDLARRAAVFAVADRIDQLAVDRDAQRGRADRAERERDEAVEQAVAAAITATRRATLEEAAQIAERTRWGDQRAAGWWFASAIRAAALAARTGGRADGE